MTVARALMTVAETAVIHHLSVYKTGSKGESETIWIDEDSLKSRIASMFSETRHGKGPIYLL